MYNPDLIAEAKFILISAAPRLHPQFLVPAGWKANFGESYGTGKKEKCWGAIKIKMNNEFQLR